MARVKLIGGPRDGELVLWPRLGCWPAPHAFLGPAGSGRAVYKLRPGTLTADYLGMKAG